MLLAKAIVEKYLGEAYRFKGRGDGGIDCYGLVVLIYRDNGIILPEIRIDENKRLPLNIQALSCLFDLAAEARFMDIVAFFNPKGIVNHAGVFIGEGRFIHATRKAGVCVSGINEPMWRERFAGAYRHREWA